MSKGAVVWFSWGWERVCNGSWASQNRERKARGKRAHTGNLRANLQHRAWARRERALLRELELIRSSDTNC